MCTFRSARPRRVNAMERHRPSGRNRPRLTEHAPRRTAQQDAWDQHNPSRQDLPLI